MTVAELISVLGEMDPTDLIVIGVCFRHGDTEYIPAADVYKAIVDVDEQPHNAVVIDCPAN